MVAVPTTAAKLLKRTTPASVVLIFVVATLLISTAAFVLGAERSEPARVMDRNAAARIAWRSLEARYHAATGLIDAAVGMPYVSAWEMGSTLAANYAARRLNFISRSEYHRRISLLLNTLEGAELTENGAFHLFYTTSSAAPVRSNPSDDAAWSAIDHGRLLLWLRRIGTEPRYEQQTRRIVARLNPRLLLESGSRDTGDRAAYQRYAAAGFTAWGLRSTPQRTQHAALSSEPMVLHGLEIGADATTLEFVRSLLERLPRSARGDTAAWISTGAAFAWHALVPGPHTLRMLAAVQPALDPEHGWNSGINEGDGRITSVQDVNTAALILESALYSALGKPLLADVVPRIASVSGVQHAQIAGPTVFAAIAALIDTVAIVLFVIVVTLILLYSLRHYLFTLNRLYGNQRHPYVDVREANWPTVTVAIPAHNEEKVITHVLDALMECDYPEDRLDILVINDRSTDRTTELINDMAIRYPGRLTAYHRTEGKPGKAAALKDALPRITSDIILVFDADYLPGKGLIKQLVAPFFDPEVGAVMGRVVPINVGANLLTRLLDLERSGGYQVDQQARMNLGVVPQFGGTVGGVRRVALESVGGWHDDTLTEDTDVTYRLLLRGWKTAYQNRSECYEEVPDKWPVRVRQITRWARGHNDCMRRYALPLMNSIGWTHWWQRVDGVMLLGVYAMSAVLVLGWVLALGLFLSGSGVTAWLFMILVVPAYNTVGNFAVFFEIAAAARLDGYRNRIRLLPFVFFSFVISVLSTARTILPTHLTWHGRHLVWHKTERSRTSAPSIL